MTFESALTWLIIAVVAVVNFLTLLLSQTGRFQQKQALRFWQQVGLPMGTDKIATAVRRRLRRSAAAASAGALAGLLGSVGILLFGPTPLSVTSFWLVVLPAVLIGMAGCDVGMALRDTLFRQQGDSPRMARAVPVSLGDYISPLRLMLAPSLLVLAVLLGAAGLALGLLGDSQDRVLQGAALPILLVALVVIAGTAVVATRVLRQTQAVTGALELAWDDAIRAETFRKMALLGATIAWLAVSAIALGILNGLDSAGGTAWGASLGSQIFNVGYLGIFYLFTYGTAYNYFRYRLWPELTVANAITGGSS